MGYNPELDPQKMEGDFTEAQKAVRDVFVNEYLKDHDAYRACIRMGFLAAFAIEQAKAFMADGYVLRKLAFMTRKPIEPSEADKAEMLANLRELAFTASGAVRATATQRYMEAQGYIKRDGEGDEEKLSQLAGILADFGKNAPA